MPTDDPFDEYIAKYSNWGRWENDQIGAANYISPQLVREAAGLVRTGRVVSLAMEMGKDGPQPGGDGRFNCMHYMMATGTDHFSGQQVLNGKPIPRRMGYSDDMVVLSLHSSTHWDSLCHCFHDGKGFNGRPAEMVTTLGSPWGGAEQLQRSLVGRGVLLDIPKVKGVDSLDDGYAISVDDLDEACESLGVQVGEGDILLVRTGQMQRARAAGWGTFVGGAAPGLSFYTIPWLAERKIAALATDTWGVEVQPHELVDSVQPFHVPAIVYMGLLLGEMFELDELAEACAEAGAYEVFMSAPPMPIVGATGGPPGPVAVL